MRITSECVPSARVTSGLLVLIPSAIVLVDELIAFPTALWAGNLPLELVTLNSLPRLFASLSILVLSFTALRRNDTATLLCIWCFLSGYLLLPFAPLWFSPYVLEPVVDWETIAELGYASVGLGLAFSVLLAEERDGSTSSSPTALLRRLVSAALFVGVGAGFLLRWQLHLTQVAEVNASILALPPDVHPIDVVLPLPSEILGRELAITMFLAAIASLLLRRRTTMKFVWMFALGIASDVLLHSLRPLAAGSYTQNDARVGLIAAVIFALCIAGSALPFVPMRRRTAQVAT
ncbi:MAG TPA: hypothetical protein VEU06_06765 [Micropepsaceae bacterium]|nr:hypothetical protein [Micropepsaceae bacterium]